MFKVAQAARVQKIIDGIFFGFILLSLCNNCKQSFLIVNSHSFKEQIVRGQIIHIYIYIYDSVFHYKGMFTGEEMQLWLLDRYLNIIGVEVKKLESKEKYIEL